MATSPILDVSNVILPNQVNSVDNTGARAIAGAANTVVEIGTDYLTDNLGTDLNNATDEAVLAAQAQQQATNQPLSSDAIASILGDKGGAAKVDEDATMRPFLEKLAKASSAEKQGAIDGTELKIRHEQILRDYISRHPRLAGQFIQATGQTLGYNPLGSEIDALTAKSGQGGAPTDPRSYIEKQYDALADELNISPTDKYRDPINWYRRVEKEASFKEKLDSDTRQFQRTTLTDQIDDLSAKQAAQRFAPNAARNILNQVTNIISQIPTTPDGKTGAIDAGSLNKMRESIMAGKAAFVQQFSEMTNGRYGNEWVQSNLGNVLSYFDFAASQADPKKALEDVNRGLEAQVDNFYLKFPSFQTQSVILKAISQVPNDSPLADALKAKLGSKVWSSMAVQLGAAWDATNPAEGTNPPPTPTIIPPPTSMNLAPKEVSQAEIQTIRGLRTIMTNALNQPDPEAKRLGALGGIRMAASAATQYLQTKDNVAPAPAVVWELTSLVGSDEYFDALGQPGISRVEKAKFIDPVDKAMTSETDNLFGNVARDMQTAIHTNKYRGFLIGYGRGDQTLPAGEFLQVVWSGGRAQFKAVPPNNVKARQLADTSPLDPLVATMNAKYSERLTQLVRAKAHIAGSKDYAGSTNEAAIRLNQRFISTANGG